MSPGIVALVLGAAVLHAAWNALLKSEGDRFRSMAIINAAAGFACVPAVIILPFPRPACWPELALSAALHLAYSLALVRAYRHGDLGQVYAVARGSSPLLVTLGAAALAAEAPDAPMLGGILLISLGILSLARGWTGASRNGIGMALATGALIAAYSVADGLGGRASGDPRSYAAWIFLIDGFPVPILLFLIRGREARLFRADRETAKSVVGGFVSLLAYGGVIYAASVSPMGPVSALRETSVVFAAVFGRVFLAEPLTRQRFASCVAVALGAILLARHGA